MKYEKQGFHSGQALRASQLNTMEEGIIKAQDISFESREIAQAAMDTVGEAKSAIKELEEARGVLEEAREATQNVQEARDIIREVQESSDVLQEARDAAQEARDAAQEASDSSVAANMEKGSGSGATQQTPDGAAAEGFVFENNPNAVNYDETLAETIPYGATGNFSSAFGGKTSAQGKRAHAEGSGTVAKGGNAHSEGSGTAALGGSSHAEGYATTAVGIASHAEGGTTQALDQNTHAEGLKTIAVGEHSHAEGEESTSIGTSSHAEGYKTVANGNYSHTEGEETKANGIAAHAGGYKSEARGNYSYAGGYHTVANKEAQHTVGKYNVGKHNTVFEVGNGKSDSERSNAFEVYENGDIGIKYNGDEYLLFKVLSDFLVDKNKVGFVSGDYSAKFIVDKMSGKADLITKRKYKAGTTVEFKYYIEDPNYLIRTGTWFKLIYTTDSGVSDIYDTASWFGTVPTDTKNQWTSFSCILPEDGYIYFGGEIGQWGAQYGESNAGRGCIYIDNVTITEDEISVTDTFDYGLNSTLFNVNNREAIVLGDGYQK